MKIVSRSVLERGRSLFYIRISMKQLFLLVILWSLLLIAGCREDHIIKLNKDGSADVTYNIHTVDTKDTINSQVKDTTGLAGQKDSIKQMFDEYYKSPLISNYECKFSDESGITVKYTISNVDSLGNFMCPVIGYPVKFKRTRHSLSIDAGMGDAEPEDDIGGTTNLFAFTLTVETPGKIKSVENSSGLPISFSDNRFTIESSVGGLNYSGKRNLVVIKY